MEDDLGDKNFRNPPPPPPNACDDHQRPGHLILTMYHHTLMNSDLICHSYSDEEERITRRTSYSK
jgi:hypothetical protein